VLGKCGHEWEATPTGLKEGTGCPVQPCRSVAIWEGRSDRWTNERFDREITHVTRLGDVTTTHEPVLVRGECDHEWSATPDNLSRGTGCPVQPCRSVAIWEGRSDRWTNERFDREFPHVTRLGDATAGLAPVLVRCTCGHEWSPRPTHLSDGHGCPACATYGYDPSKPGYLYLMERPGEQQIGITNVPDDRLGRHRRDGWSLVELIGPMDGQVAFDRERAMKQFIQTLDTVPGTLENWLTVSFEASSIADVEAAALVPTLVPDPKTRKAR
jgi:hypothetical protein